MEDLLDQHRVGGRPSALPQEILIPIRTYCITTSKDRTQADQASRPRRVVSHEEWHYFASPETFHIHDGPINNLLKLGTLTFIQKASIPHGSSMIIFISHGPDPEVKCQNSPTLCADVVHVPTIPDALQGPPN